MIVVIADDFSGAAEVAGSALARGRTALVQTEFDPSIDADVIVIDCNTRSCHPADAATRVRQVAGAVAKSDPEWIYKKIDSLLRGPVIAELKAVQQVLHAPLAVVAPANPSRGRIVLGGKLLIDGQEVDETSLAHDPEHPIESSSLVDRLSDDDASVQSLGADQRLPESGVSIIDAACTEDLRRLAKRTNPQTLAVGGVDFFDALLSERSSSKPPAFSFQPSKPRNDSHELLVCGSLAAWPKRERDCLLAETPIFFPPLGAGSSSDTVIAWSKRTSLVVASHPCIMIAIGPTRPEGLTPRELTEQFVGMVASLLDNAKLSRIYVEGGATASSLVRCCGWSSLRVVAVPSQGVVELATLGQEKLPTLVVKPGSYDWPASVQQRLFGSEMKTPS